VKPTYRQIGHARKLADKEEHRQYVVDLLNAGCSTPYGALAG
jgi:hypothetical protein